MVPDATLRLHRQCQLRQQMLQQHEGGRLTDASFLVFFRNHSVEAKMDR